MNTLIWEPNVTITFAIYSYIIVFSDTFVSVWPAKVLGWISSYQKWIPDKILHRYSNSIFFWTFFFQQKFSFWKWKNIFSGNFSKCHFWNEKIDFGIFFGIFTLKYFWPIFFSKIFLTPKKKYFSSELNFLGGHNFDVENWELSIGDVFRAIPALYCELGAKMCHQNFKNPSGC